MSLRSYMFVYVLFTACRRYCACPAVSKVVR